MTHLRKWWMVHSAWILGLTVALWQPFSQYASSNPKLSLLLALGAVVVAKISASPFAPPASSNLQNQAVQHGGTSTAAGFGRLGVMRAIAAVSVIFAVVMMAACNAYQTAERAHDVVTAVISVAQADLPSLEATGVFSVSEGQAVTNYLTLATNLNGQYATCLTNANNTTLNKNSKFLACLDAFAAGLSDPKELALLRVMSSKAQQQVQLWVTAASVGISSVIAALGGQSPPTPQVAAVPTSKVELQTFSRRLDIINSQPSPAVPLP